MKFKDLLFLDIETIPQVEHYKHLSDSAKRLWNKKARLINKSEDQTPENIYHKAGIYAEFGKIISIAVGYISETEGISTLRIKDFSGHSETELLKNFKTMLEEGYNEKKLRLCAHNGKEFDFPYIARRMVINEIELPQCLQLSGKKPWEIPHIDTLELWKFGDYKHFTSLELLAHIFGIPTSKDDIDGSQVYQVYYEEKNLRRIAKYCQRDVAVLTQVYLRLQGLKLINPKDIHYVQ